MKIAAGQTVLLTGASGGIGTYIAEEFVSYGVNLFLVAHPGADLQPLRERLEKRGIEAFSMTADLREPEQRHQALEETRGRFGKIDVLINNAGVEFTSPLHELSEEAIRSVIQVNLEAPLILSRLVLPEMLERMSGHIVNMSSLAGKSGPALQEPYAATKAGLIAFTTSLRASYRKAGVSASVICPGFVEAGIYARLRETSGHEAPALLGTVGPRPVARAVIKAIQKDRAQILVNRFPIRPLLALSELSPAAGALLVRMIGGHEFFWKVYRAQKKGRKPSG